MMKASTCASFGFTGARVQIVSMLVLTRRADEAVVIGKDVVVRVLGVEKNGQVRLGIEAPRDVRILRRRITQRGKCGESFGPRLW